MTNEERKHLDQLFSEFIAAIHGGAPRLSAEYPVAGTILNMLEQRDEELTQFRADRDKAKNEFLELHQYYKRRIHELETALRYRGVDVEGTPAPEVAAHWGS